MIWLTADQHFGHDNQYGGIVAFCKRPFTSVEEMDQQLIDNINNCVDPSDTLYHLGDFSFRGQGAAHYRDQIKCKEINLIVGNHDPRTKSGQPKKHLFDIFSSVTTTLNIHVIDSDGEKHEIILNHWPQRTWHRSHYGTYHAYGHHHAELKEDPSSLSFDVGVDAIAKRIAEERAFTRHLRSPEDYRPISIMEFFKWIKPKVPVWKKSGHRVNRKEGEPRFKPEQGEYNDV